MPLSSGALNSLVTWGFSTGTPTPARPTAWYTSLHTGNPGSTGANEASGSGYARQSIGSMTISGAQASNAAALNWTFAAALSGISYAGVFDAATAGNFWASMQLVQQGTLYQVSAVAVASGGSGYVSGDVGKTVSITGAGGATATITAVTSGVVTGIQLASAGSGLAAASLPADFSALATQTGVTTGTGLTVQALWTATTMTYSFNANDSFTLGAGQLLINLGAPTIMAPS